MESRKSFEDLIVWQKAHEFVLLVYRYTSCFPKHELYGLTSQFRRASVSIAANIAEGFKKKDKLRFYNISQGSLEECRYYIRLSKDLSYIEDISRLKLILEDTSRLLNSYYKAISASLPS